MRSLLIATLLAACGGKSTPPVATEPPPTTTPPAGGECIKGGCSGTRCTEPGNDMATTCEFKAEYACYNTAECKRQDDGACGFTQTAELTACLANPPPMQ